MSYELVGDSGETLGQFASSMGYAELIDGAGKSPVLQSLFEHGASDQTKAVIAALDTLASANGTSQSVADTARALALLAKGQDFIVITNGVETD